jgi:hypothetical protein
MSVKCFAYETGGKKEMGSDAVMRAEECDSVDLVLPHK